MSVIFFKTKNWCKIRTQVQFVSKLAAKLSLIIVIKSLVNDLRLDALKSKFIKKLAQKLLSKFIAKCLVNICIECAKFKFLN